MKYALKPFAQVRYINPDAHRWLSDIPPHHWSLSCFDTRHHVEHVTNNHTESFNVWVDKVRYKPMIALLEGLRVKLFSLMWSRREAALKNEDRLTPRARSRLKKLLNRARYARVYRVGEYEFQVDFDDKRCVVRLNDKYCICGQWQVRGIPCVHACACITYTRGNVDDYCSAWFTNEAWKKCYETLCHPIPDESMWPVFENMELNPPVAKKQSGRPKKVRIRSSDEPAKATGQSATKRCRNCLMFGHNIRSCKVPRAEGVSATHQKRRRQRRQTSQVMNTSNIAFLFQHCTLLILAFFRYKLTRFR